MTLIQLNPITHLILQAPVNPIIIVSIIIDTYYICSTLFLIIIYVQNDVLHISYCNIVHTILYTNLQILTYHIYLVLPTIYLPIH